MKEILQFSVLGLGTAAIYALLASGAVLIYRGSGVVNFAHGAFALVGAILFAELHGSMPVLVLLVVVVIAGVLVGAAMQILVMRRLSNAAPLVRVIATLGVLIAVQAAAALHYGEILIFVDPFLPQEIWTPFDITVQSDRVLLFLIALAVTIALTVIQRRWLPALATRAAAENEMAVSAIGWSPNSLAIGNWMAGGALATLAGALVVPVTGLVVTNVVSLAVPALAAALVGRFTSFPLAFLGATVIGVSQALILNYWDQPGAATAVPFLLVLLILVVTGAGIPLRSHIAERLPTVGSGRMRPLLAISTFTAGVVLMLWVLPVNAQDALTVSLASGVILLSIVVLTGYAGQISLAQFAVAGMGVFVASKLIVAAGFPLLAGWIVGIVAAVPIGLALALPALRTRGVTLAVITLGLAYGASAVFFNNSDYTGDMVVGTAELFGIPVDSVEHPDRYGVLALIGFALAAVMVSNLRRSAAGRQLLAIRQNERAASALGVSVVGAKVYAFGLASALASLGGILLAFRGNTIDFVQFNPLVSIYLVAYAVLGGVGFVAGGLIGSVFVLGGVGTLLNVLFEDIDEVLPLIAGVSVVVVLLIDPDGIVGSWAGRLQDRRKKRALRQAGAKRVAGDAALGGVAADGDAAATSHARVEPQELVVQGATVRFGGVTAVDDVSFVASPGEILGVIGPNGAGKTTLIDAITGFARLDGGSIQLGDRELSKMPASKRVGAGLARSWQSLELFDDVTVYENVLLASDSSPWTSRVADPFWPGKGELNERATAAVDHFGLGDKLMESPEDLSYGLRRLLAVARTVSLNPTVLLLDEPAAGLSGPESQELASLLRSLAASSGMTVVLIEHDMDLVMSVCDQLVVLDFGKVIATGTPEEVRTNRAVIEAYLGTEEVGERV